MNLIAPVNFNLKGDNVSIEGSLTHEISLGFDELVSMLICELGSDPRIVTEGPLDETRADTIRHYVCGANEWTETPGRLSTTRVHIGRLQRDELAIVGECSVRAAKALRELYQALHKSENTCDERSDLTSDHNI